MPHDLNSPAFDNQLSLGVQLQWMRPEQVECAARAFPVVYVPFGLLEWHGKHLPLGVDALKAHAILVKAAMSAGGLVYPPVFFPSCGWNNGVLREEDVQVCVPVVNRLFERLKKMGFRVIIGVSGHNIREQILMIDEALKPVIADGTVAGGGFWEFNLCENEDASSDHAAKWETSDMMFFYPDTVDLAALGTGPLAPKMAHPDGIGGLDPREHATPDVGRRKGELCAAALAQKARELLESLPPEYRGFGLSKLVPGQWWEV